MNTLCYDAQNVRKCCDPFKQHRKPCRKSLRKATEALAIKSSHNVKPGEMFCISCRMKIGKLSPSNSTSQPPPAPPSSSSSSENVVTGESLNQIFLAAGCSPLRIRKISSSNKVPYMKKKVRNAVELLCKKSARLVEKDKNIFQTPKKVLNCKHCDGFKNIMEELKVKFFSSDYRHRQQILTLVPPSWTLSRTASFFSCSKHLVIKSRKLKRESGILSLPHKKKGKTIDEHTTQSVIDFYNQQEISICCPGKKDFVTVTEGQQKVYHQKKILLANIKEIYFEFVKQKNLKIGFSTFFKLRPPWCVTVSSPGAHRVCICEYHQNIKLMLESVPLNHCYKFWLEKLVCNINSRECMLHRCEECPGKLSVENNLRAIFEEAGISIDNTISFYQWSHDDNRSSLISVQDTVDSFIERFSQKLDELSSHHYISKEQSKYLSDSKENLKNSECIALMDFAENYSVIIQDAIQSHHWSNTQVTLHPIVLYYRDDENLSVKSVCMISDCLDHNVSAVYAFQKHLINYVKQNLKNVTLIKYFSDGAVSQYKNYKNFSNLIHHKEDFGLKAEWHFFATSHGKSPCDGIGGTTKRLVARASLQASTKDQILNARDFYTYADAKINGIKFFWVDKKQIKDLLGMLEKRFRSADKIKGCRSHHSFIPDKNDQLLMKRLSSDLFGYNFNKNESEDNNDDYEPGRFVALVYDKKWYLGNIIERDDKNDDLKVNCLKKFKENIFYWPKNVDICYVPFKHILILIPDDNISYVGKIYITLPETVFEHISTLYNNFKLKKIKKIDT
ncbi:hypothetical protein HELRODRAFT_167749 [Helobdella robusta]|uniref:Uncharacterized protein n=1 Tax=Helobdella robusta TaxID=6412 RepID=T1EZR1_HELRO|nr:hypothetical protein HELRODRAFT_167749 [Helobdella robusta]ESO09924.1 hypothetical protein HELRODRAFT_167749 [Helobdella robusta]